MIPMTAPPPPQPVASVDNLAFQARLLDIVRQAVIVTTPDGIITYWNRFAEELYGWAVDEVIGRNIVDVTPSEMTREQADAIMSSLRQGQTWTGDFLVQRKDGSTFWAEVADTPILDADGRLAGIVGTSIDVTDRRDAEQARRATEDQYRSLIEALPLVTYVEHVGSGLIFTSPQIEVLTGFTVNEWTIEQDFWFSRLHPDDRDRVIAEVARTNETGDPFHMEHRLITRDGRVIWIRNEAHLRRDEDGRPLYWQGYWLNITREKNATDALASAEDRYRTIIENIPIVTYSEDITSAVMYTSPQIEQLSGYAADEWSTNPYFWLEITHPDDRAAVLAEIARTDETGDPFCMEYRYVHRDGHVVWIHNEAILIRNDDGAPRHWQGFILDITAQKEAEASLLLSEQRHRALVQGASDIIAVVTSGDAFDYVSPSVTTLLGYDVQEMVARPVLEYIHPDDHHVVTTAMANRWWNPEQTVRVEFRFRHRNGTWRWLEATGRNLEDQPGVHGIVINARDVTDRKLVEDRFRALIQNAEDMIGILALDGRLIYESPAITTILGYDPADMIGTPGLAYVHPDDLDEVGTVLRRVLEHPEDNVPVSYRCRHADGSWRLLEGTLTNLIDDEAVGGIVINARDVTERKRLEAEVTHQAFHDTLTGLPNRALFLDRLTHALLRSSRAPASVAVLFLDIDNFKIVNDSLGHAAGDVLLSEVGNRLRLALREGDTVARLGGDEFTILVEDVEGIEQVLVVADRLLEALRQPVMLDDRAVPITTSVGITLGAAHLSAADLIRDADLAMYRAKGDGKNRFAVFDPAMHLQALHRLEVEHDLRIAIERQQFTVLYQPEVTLDTSSMFGFEALVRWEHPTYGTIPPAEFIPIAEETGLIEGIGRVVLREASHRAASWLESFTLPDRFAMSVNLSPRQFRDPHLVEGITTILKETGLPPRYLMLEITESSLMDDPERSTAILRAIHDIGVQIAIDDFGTGYSSLARLQRFPVAFLKIDRSFVWQLGDEASGSVLVKSMIDLAQAMGMQAVAEGVETEEQEQLLRTLGCDIGQGYLYARPLDAAAATSFLADHC